jgi:hypothetical protein
VTSRFRRGCPALLFPPVIDAVRRSQSDESGEVVINGRLIRLHPDAALVCARLFNSGSTCISQLQDACLAHMSKEQFMESLVHLAKNGVIGLAENQPQSEACRTA